MDINYDDLKEEVIQFLGNNQILVLATSANNRVTGRSMACASKGLTVYCQTDRRFLKFKQIEQNPQVALCAQNVQIEGVAKIRKHPLDPSNKEFVEFYSKAIPRAFETYSHLKNFVVIEVEPTLITLWKTSEGKRCREFLRIQEKKAEREFYDMSE